MHSYIVKANIKKEVLDSYRPAKIKGLLAKLTFKTIGSNDEDELIDGLGRLKVK